MKSPDGLYFEKKLFYQLIIRKIWMGRPSILKCSR